ncbi:protein phosphatase 1B isoform X2 [Strongylocentrotus purpuratus]|uniref:Protein phosphatase 1B n=1 Tax=Strongylocentrotus purpuratus TaxID=7668 RepID=A0A7M7HR31_STRPU|nr:protein phosphatase 1B isoform X2 [Strongylocentrotus purpuratus]|eukprot:XP_011682451.1 PREDICTED: protein phosphatase 1B isoform X2 [Strongylocentrotus purpuratus]
MGAFLEKPNTEKENERGSGNGLRYGLSSMQGWRVEMEDAHSAVTGLPHGLKDWSFFAVFDGHAGSKVAKHCSEHILHEITSNPEFLGSPKVDGKLNPSTDAVKEGIRTGFLSIDSKMRTDFARTDSSDKSGSTAVGVIISPKHLFFANCGDSRSVLSRKGEDKPTFSTEDHKPGKPKEMKRIEDAGGSVMIERVNGSLAVSRALGDYDYKNNPDKPPTEQLVSPEPEVTVFERTDEEEFIILACDGIWDVMSNEELCQFIRSRLAITDNLEEICNQVIETCLQKGSRDNMSIVIVLFQNAPEVSQDALTKEKELDVLLEEKVKEVMENFGDQTQLDLVMHVLRMADIPGLPPGGGLSAKKGTIEEILNRLIPNRKHDEMH